MRVASIGYEVNTRGIPPWVRLFYTFTESKEAIDYRIRLVTTQPRFGEVRWWFICSLLVNGLPSGRTGHFCCHLYSNGFSCHDIFPIFS